jgi:hypothetical protein
MKNDENKEQIVNPTMNIVFCFDLQMSSNCNSARFGMEQFKDDMSKVSVELLIIFTWSS